MLTSDCIDGNRILVHVLHFKKLCYNCRRYRALHKFCMQVSMRWIEHINHFVHNMEHVLEHINNYSIKNTCWIWTRYYTISRYCAHIFLQKSSKVLSSLLCQCLMGAKMVIYHLTGEIHHKSINITCHNWYNLLLLSREMLQPWKWMSTVTLSAWCAN